MLSGQASAHVVPFAWSVSINTSLSLSHLSPPLTASFHRPFGLSIRHGCLEEASPPSQPEGGSKHLSIGAVEHLLPRGVIRSFSCLSLSPHDQLLGNTLLGGSVFIQSEHSALTEGRHSVFSE